MSQEPIGTLARPPMGTASPKPTKGEVWLDARKRRAEREAHEEEQMDAARKRDMALCRGCRWPRCQYMAKKPRLEVMHVFEHRKAGGDPTGERTLRHLLMLGCFIHHRQIDLGDLEVRPHDEVAGTDGTCDFYGRNEAGVMELIASEKMIGVSEMRGR